MSGWPRQLVALGACADAVAWAKTQPDLATAWATCERGEWMLWLAGRTCEYGDTQHRCVVVAAAACARLALPQYEAAYPGDARPRLAIEAAEAWAAQPSAAASDAAMAAARDARDAARAAWDAWSAAWAAAKAAMDAAWATAWPASDAAWATASAAASDATLRRCADLVRVALPEPPRLEAPNA